MRKKTWISLGVMILFISQAELDSQILINEFVASNVDGGYYDAIYDDYPDWIELRNTSASSIDLGNYYLTDDLGDLNKWQIPEGTVIAPNGYFLFIADGRDELNRTNFKLSADGETIGISDPQKRLLDSVVFLPQSSNISMGRLEEDPAVWAYFPSPTPNSANTTTGFSGKSMAPELDKTPGFYDQAIQLAITSHSPSAAIRYTLDGSRPTVNSIPYTGPIQINSSTVVRAICSEDDLMPSEVMTATYFIGETATLPVFSFSMSPGQESAFPFNTETAVHVEYFDKDRKQVINQDIGSRITGLVGIHPMRSFSLYARSAYGENRMDHRFFNNKPITSFKNLTLRNGGYQDYSYTYLRDGLIQSFVIGALDLEYQSYQPVLVFRNGRFLALMNLREKENEFFVESNGGVDKDSIDFLEYQTEPPIDVLMGDAVHFNQMMSFIENADLSQQENMDYLETRMDVKNYLDYYMLEIYCANADWPDKNSKIWRPKQTGGRWRWMVFDVDYGYGFAYPVEQNMYEYLYNLEEPYYHNRPWVTVIFRKIMENEGMRNYYLQRFNALLNTVFHQDRALHMLDSLKAAIEPEMQRHIAKWGSLPYGIPSMEEWQNNCAVLYDFARRRPQFARKNMMDFYGLEDTVTVEVISKGGMVKVNDFQYSSDSLSGQFFSGIPLELEAVPDNGYEFVEWINVSGAGQTSNTFVPNTDTTIEAVFRPVSNNILDGTFSGDAVLADRSEPYIARGHLVIPPNVEVILEEGIELLMPEGCNIYVYGTLKTHGSEQYPVLINAYTDSWGGICLDHATGTSDFRYLTLKGASTGGDPDIYRGAISAYYSDLNLTGVLIEQVPANPVFTQFGNIHVDSCRFHSAGSCDLVNIKDADLAIVEHSVFMDSKMVDTDAIDFDHVKSGIIRYNRIHNLIGENSDGIDIGESSQQVEIYNNLITNCRDKGISIGQNSHMNVYRNVIYNCNHAIAVKDFGSSAVIENNSLVNNAMGVSCYEKNLGSGAGTAFIQNSILADSRIASLVVRNDGEIEIAYSISNTDFLEGSGNLYGDPEMVAPDMLNFELLQSSPCIDGGNPGSPLDGDGSRADIGAYYVSSWPDMDKDLIINEYFGNSSEGEPDDWIELYNKGDEVIDVSGWYVKDGGNSSFRIPDSTFIEGNSFAVLCSSAENFRESYDEKAALVVGNFDFALGNSRDKIKLFDRQYNPVTSIQYDEDTGWPDSNEKKRLSVALIDTSLSMNEGLHWRTSYKMYGTPGYSNIPPRISGLYINELSGAQQTQYADDFGEYEDWIELFNNNTEEINFGGLYLTDDLSKPAMSRIRPNAPDSTSIGAGGFGVLFADGEPEQGILHLDFKISAAGEELGLVQLVGLDTVILDQVSFGTFQSDYSLGRFTDGGVPWVQQDFTPGASNTASLILDPDENFATVYPNPAKDQLHICLLNESMGRTDITLLNALGQVEMTRNYQHVEPFEVITLDVSDREAGIYFLKVSSGNIQCVKRIMVIR